MENIKVSLFKDYKKTEPIKEVSLIEWLKDESLKLKVEEIRTIEDKETRNKLKATLPCITPSGTFSVRKVNGLIKHSGYICIDIDAKDNPEILDFEKCRDDLSNIQNIMYAGLSVSGKGVFALIPIKFPEKHAEHFEALNMCFSELGITIDKSCKDVGRLRGGSYDANAHINLDAEMFIKYFDYRELIEKSLVETPYYEKRNLDSEDFTKKRVLQIIDSIKSSRIDITEEYAQWFQIGCALANEFGEEGRELFHAVSQNHQKYFHESCNNMFTQCSNNSYKYTIGTFFHWAKEYGLI